MGIGSSIVVFLLVWWTLLFTVLPFGNDRHQGEVAGTDPGAPQFARIKRKFIITTLVSAIVWLIIYLAVANDIMSFRVLAEHMEMQ